MQTSVTVKGSVNVEIPLELFNETIVENLNEDQIFDILLTGIDKNKMLASTIIERFKDDYSDEIEEMINDSKKELQHHYDTTVGLYAFDFDPKELLHRFSNSQSDAHYIECVAYEQLELDWAKWIDGENIEKCPIFQIK